MCLFLPIPDHRMKSKRVSLVLALLGGSAGADRFYLGQQTAGWLTLLGFWFVLPGAIYSILQFNLAPNWEPFLLAKYALPVLWHIVATGRIMIISDEKFMSQDESKGKFSPMVIGCFIVAAILAVGASRMIASVKAPDIDKVDSKGESTSVTLSQEFRSNEENFRKQYDNKAFVVTGKVTETGMDFEMGAYFALQGIEGDPFGIKCLFSTDHQTEPEKVKMGDEVKVKGIINGNKLENCTILELNGSAQ